MAELSGHVATVSAQQGDRVLISVPMVGFPAGFQLRQGDRVAVLQGAKGTIAVPLVRSFEATPQQAAALSGAGGGGGNQFAVQEATVQSGEGNRVVVFTVEREGTVAPQVFAVRRDD